MIKKNVKAAKTILVTGSSRGIGAELARRFAEDGHRIILNCRRFEDDAARLLARIQSACGPDRAIAVRADVTQRAEVAALFDTASHRFDSVDVLVNCAGLNIDRPFLQMTDAEWENVVSTILTGTFICSQEFARRYPGDCGHIITIGALTAFHGRKNGANYCSARAGVINLTKCMAQELAPAIRVNCVVPGWIDTEEVVTRFDLGKPENMARVLASIPMGRMGNPGDIYALIDFIIGRSTYQTGHTFFADGGYLMG